MHEDTQKLINIVTEGRDLSPHQKEIILKRARKNGDDLIEVETILEMLDNNFSSKKENNNEANSEFEDLSLYVGEKDYSREKTIDSVRQDTLPSNSGAKPAKNKLAAALLAIFLGGFGAHKFYMGNTKMGICYLLLSFTMIPSIVSIVEGVIYLLDTDEAFNLRINK